MTSTTMETTRVSLRDIFEAAFRGLTAHGASHGEARTAAQMVLAAELFGGSGLAALQADLQSPSWSRTPVEVCPTPAFDDPGYAVLRSPVGNRLLREAPLAVELVASDGDVRVVAVPTVVAGPILLDTVALEAARVSGAGVVVVVCSSGRPRDETAREDPQQSGHVRSARPDGSLGVAILDPMPDSWQQMVLGSGVLAMRETELLDDIEMGWTSAIGRAEVRAEAAAGGVVVDAELWRSVYQASRRYLVPGR